MRPALRQTWQAALLRTLPRCRVLNEGNSLHYPKCTAPTGLVKEMKRNMREEADALAEVSTPILVRRGVERPVNEHWPPNDILFRDETPIPAVEADVAIVPHTEIAVLRDNHVLSFNMSAHEQLPLGRDVVGLRGRYGREVVAIRIVSDGSFMHDIGLVELFAISIHRAVDEVDPVARNSDDSLHDIKPRLGGRKENDDVSPLDVAIRQDRHPGCFWSELFAIDEDVVADEECVLHGTRRDLECLEDECDDEKARDQHCCQGSEKLNRCFARFFFRSVVFLRQFSVPGRSS